MDGSLDSLLGYLSDLPRAALAFSGGTDSSFLLWACMKAGADVRPYFVRGNFQTADESEHAAKVASLLGADLKVIDIDTLSFSEVAANTPDRCYLCKKNVFTLIKEISESDGRLRVIDATNASDDPASRPGMRALRELGVVSPLRECGLTKPTVRMLSKEAGLDNWNVPSNSCLATRIPTGTRITADALEQVERTEMKLRAFGLMDFRVRSFGDTAKLEIVPAEQSFVDGHISEISEMILEDYQSVIFGVRQPGL